jgi:cob(I)alamin adenosyltransferase
MKIYTKKGDKGQTSLLGGSRVPKTHLRIESYGTLDELNSHIGMLRDLADLRTDELIWIQNQLFSLGSILALEKKESNWNLPQVEESHIAKLEEWMDQMDQELEPMKNFVLPGGHPAVSQAHISRTVCRRAERLVIALSSEVELSELNVGFLNRLSDYLFVMARWLTKEHGISEIPWKSDT